MTAGRADASRTHAPVPGRGSDRSGAHPRPLGTTGAMALYVGAVLGPSLMLIPGLAADIAGPASVVAWGMLILLSGSFAWVFAGLGVHIPHGGVTAYATAGFGPRAGRVMTWCFVAGAFVGTPYVCVIGGSYFTALFGLGRIGAALAAAALLAAVVTLSAVGARVGVRVQVVLVLVMIAIALVAASGTALRGHVDNWTPFLPHGWAAVGTAASLVAIGFFGWEATSPLIGRMAHPARQLPRVVAVAFAVTSLVYLAVVISTISVLGDHAGPAPLAALLDAVVGRAGPVLAAIIAIVLTLAASNAYLAGAVATVRLATPRRPVAATRWFYVAISTGGVLGLAAYALGLLDLQLIVQLPTALSLAIYLVCSVAAARILHGAVRVVASACAVLVVVLLVFTGWAVIAPIAVSAAAILTRGRARGDVRRSDADGG